MLQRAASSAYSWWWASHIRTKQSKWLEQNLQDMEDKVGSMLGIIDEDGDSFARRAEMYYRKRPELVHLVEESFRAYRALAERYDHISRDLQSANRTIATVYPEKVHFSAMDDDDDEEEEEEESQEKVKKLVEPDGNGTLKPPIPNVPPIKSFKPLPTFHTKRAQQQKQPLKRTVSSARAVPCSGLNKGEALREIDKLQKGILALQTEKEFIKSSYENAVAKYLEIENRINEMQGKVCILQDEFGIGTVIEDNEARKLMVSTALKSCQETLNKLEEKQANLVREASMEHEKIKDTHQKFQAFKNEFCGELSDNQELGEINKYPNVMPTFQTLEDKMKEPKDAYDNKSLSVTHLVDKIDDIVDKVVNLETAVASSSSLVQRLRVEAGELQEHVQDLEAHKDQVVENSNIIRQKMVELEAKMVSVHNLKKTVEDQNTSIGADFTRASSSLDQLSEKVEHFKFDDIGESSGWNVGGKYGNEQIMSPGNNLKISEQRKGDKFLNIVSQLLSTSSNEKGQNSDSVGQGHENIMITDNGLSSSSDSELKHSTSDQLQHLLDESECSSCIKDESVEKIQNDKSGEEDVEDHLSSKNMLETITSYQSLVLHQLLPDDSVQLGMPQREHMAENEEHTAKLALPEEAASSDHSVEATFHSVDESFRDHVNKNQNPEDTTEQSAPYPDTKYTDQEWKQIEETFKLESLLSDGNTISITNTVSDSPQVDQEEETKLETADGGKSRWRKLVEDKEGQLDWRRLFLSGLEDREKFLVDEYTSVINSLKEARRKLSEVEKKNREGLTEQASKMKQIMHANSLKDAEIQSLRQTVSLLKSNNTTENDAYPLPDTPQWEQIEEARPKEVESLVIEMGQSTSNDATENTVTETPPARGEINLNDEPHIVSTLEDKFRSDLDEMLGENLEFWLRFCTSVHQIQKFQSSIEDLEIEAARLIESKKQGTNSKNLESLKSDATPIYKHLKDIQTELNLWLQHNSLLKEEVEDRHSSLSDIEEDITRLSNATEDLNEYQAAKFQGEVASMKQENNKVTDELQSCLGRVKAMQTDTERIIVKLNEEFGISESERKRSRSKIPLRTFLFGVRLKKQKHSFFRCISPSLQKQYSDLASQFPPPR